jgi:hypothetical protein
MIQIKLEEYGNFYLNKLLIKYVYFLFLNRCEKIVL